MLRHLLLIAACHLLMSGCASTYGNLTSGSKLGAQEYQPAVYVKNPSYQQQYAQILSVCRQAAVNGQITASQRAQLDTITGGFSGAVEGAAMGAQLGALFKGSDLAGGGAIEKGLGIGLVGGLASSLAGSFSSGVSNTADKTRMVLLNCLKAADREEKFYVVLE